MTRLSVLVVSDQEINEMADIEAEIEALEMLNLGQLIERYKSVVGTAPRVKNRQHLIRRVAWRLQEDRLGGLSKVAKRRLNDLIAELDVDLGPATDEGGLRRRRSNKELTPGTTLARQWHDQEIIVYVRPDGFEHDGRIYPSLTAIATAVTGAHWNGRLFFGLTKRRRKA